MLGHCSLFENGAHDVRTFRLNNPSRSQLSQLSQLMPSANSIATIEAITRDLERSKARSLKSHASTRALMKRYASRQQNESVRAAPQSRERVEEQPEPEVQEEEEADQYEPDAVEPQPQPQSHPPEQPALPSKRERADNELQQLHSQWQELQATKAQLVRQERKLLKLMDHVRVMAEESEDEEEEEEVSVSVPVSVPVPEPVVRKRAPPRPIETQLPNPKNVPTQPRPSRVAQNQRQSRVAQEYLQPSTRSRVQPQPQRRQPPVEKPPTTSWLSW